MHVNFNIGQPVKYKVDGMSIDTQVTGFVDVTESAYKSGNDVFIKAFGTDFFPCPSWRLQSRNRV